MVVRVAFAAKSATGTLGVVEACDPRTNGWSAVATMPMVGHPAAAVAALASAPLSA